MADMRGWSVVVMVVVCMQMAQGCFPPPPRPKPCPGKPSETQNTTEKKPCIFPFLDADGKTEFTECATLEGYSKENTYCATSLNKDCTYKELGVCVEGGCLLTRSTRGDPTSCNEGCTIKRNTYIDSDTINDKFQVRDMEECASKCDESKECKFWSYNTNNPKNLECELKSSNNGENPNKPGFVTGSKGCALKKNIEGCTIKRNTNIAVVTINEKFPSITMEQCASKCGINEKCEFWSYDTNDPKKHMCELKTSNNGESSEKPGFVTGSKGCALKEDIEGCTIERNTYIIDNAFDVKFRGVNIEECASKCGENEECIFWSYKTSTQDCYLKSPENGGSLNIPGFVTGSKGCALKEIIEGCIIERNIILPDDSISTVEVTSLRGCALACIKENECKFWNFKDKECSLYADNSNKKREKGVTFGSWGCGLNELKWTGENGNAESKCHTELTTTMDKAKEIKENELSKLWVDGDQDGCAQFCGSELYCTEWAYRQYTKKDDTKKSKCKLFKRGEGNDWLGNKEYVKGNKECALISPTPTVEQGNKFFKKYDGKWYKEEDASYNDVLFKGSFLMSFYNLPKGKEDPEYDNRCLKKNKPPTFLKKSATNTYTTQERLAQVAIRILYLMSPENIYSQTIAIALAKHKISGKIILYIAGNVKTPFKKHYKFSETMHIIKSEFDGEFDEVFVINPDATTFGEGGYSHYHAEMQIVRYQVKHTDIEITHMGISKTPCCACNVVLRKSLEREEYENLFPLIKEEKYNGIFENMYISSGNGSPLDLKTVCNDKREAEFCGSQYHNILEINEKWGERLIAIDWKHPSDKSWNHHNNGLLNSEPKKISAHFTGGAQ